ncbi:hypothetical protein N5853_07215 [Bartonella sp. HY329]|uniref:hypothetical protein n=1 Tax=unclassified Bartonella TaxID=2645622 RepID=UPI0021C618F3|nr:MULTISPECIES: hypothetical protein [unclassified Bartonella]UXM93921.1 hypothetical protein N5853_07215 [Bartonella sp. HY329]UXN08242.1 hypothetical protein N5852_07225 [Bartonella sp. HY328]
MAKTYAHLLDETALCILNWPDLWPPRHSNSLTQSQPLKGPWPRVEPPSPSLKPMVVSRLDAKKYVQQSRLLRLRYYPDADKEALMRELTLEFLRLALPEYVSNLSQLQSDALIADHFTEAHKQNFGEMDCLTFWSVLSILAGNDFYQLRYVNLWLQIEYRSKDVLLERLIQGLNVTMHNPWLAILTNNVGEETTYSNGTIIYEDNFGQIIRQE